MNTTFVELKTKIVRILSDEVSVTDPMGGSSYSADVLKDGVHAALDAICGKCWKPATASLAGSLDLYDLPEDLIDVESVYEKELGTFIPKIEMSVGNKLWSSAGNGWLLYPYQKITFMNPLDTTGADIYYSARWAKPDLDTDVIEPPSSTLICLVLFAASYCLMPDSVSSASIDRFKTRVDSGQPTDNPAMQMSNFFLHRFEYELQRLPLMEKGRQS